MRSAHVQAFLHFTHPSIVIERKMLNEVKRQIKELPYYHSYLDLLSVELYTLNYGSNQVYCMKEIKIFCMTLQCGSWIH